MAKQKPDGISWTDETWNPIYGCSIVSAGCTNCYAMNVAQRFSGAGQVYEGLAVMTSQGAKWTGKLKLVEESLDKPLRWRRPRRIFVNSMSDLFHEDVHEEFIDKVFAIMGLAFVMRMSHTFQVLTKRAVRMYTYFQDPETVYRVTRMMKKLGPGLAGENAPPVWPLPNVWLGVSVENQATADARIPLLLQTPAAVRWLSMEPLLGPVDLERVKWPKKAGHRVDVLRAGYWNKAPFQYGAPAAGLGEPKGGFTNHSDMKKIDWVVVGGESGKNARPMHPDWVRTLRDQCREAGVPFHFKQWGEYRPAASVEEATTYPVIASNREVAAPTPEAKQSKPASRCFHMLHQVESMLDGTGQYAHLDCAMFKSGKKAAGRLLDGALHDEYPKTMPATITE